jgi:hypothetical protein
MNARDAGVRAHKVGFESARTARTVSARDGHVTTCITLDGVVDEPDLWPSLAVPATVAPGRSRLTCSFE